MARVLKFGGFGGISAAVLVGLAGLAPAVYAQVDPGTGPGAAPDPAAIKDVENSKFATTGIISSNAVYVRCGPGDNYYPTMKLDKGAKVKVVGAKFDWLKVTPPEGSFCYVAKLYVDRHGNGSVGRVNKDSINVRAGSALSALKIGILCELRQGEEVEILGEEQEYFKIKPPAAAYVYINKKFVDPDPEAKPEVQVAGKTETVKDAGKTEAVKPDGAGAFATGNAGATDFAKPDGAGATGAATNGGNAGSATTSTDGAGNATAAKPEMIKPENVKPEDVKPETAGGPNDATGTNSAAGTAATNNTGAATAGTTTTQQATGAEAVKPKDATGTAGTDTTAKVATPAAPRKLTEAEAEALFDKAEAEYLASKDQPLEQQPIDSMAAAFEALSKTDKLPESMRRVAESRLLTVQARKTAQRDLARLRESQNELRQKQMALEAEQRELQQRIAEKTVRVYTAVGTLQPSSLQQGTGVLYRVTDPATGRTVCYMRSDDTKVISLLGQFVGIKGQLTDDQRLGAKVIIPTDLAAVDPAAVHQSVTAQIIPSSLMPKEPTQASTDPQQ